MEFMPRDSATESIPAPSEASLGKGSHEGAVTPTDDDFRRQQFSIGALTAPSSLLDTTVADRNSATDRHGLYVV